MSSGLILPDQYRTDQEYMPDRMRDRTYGANLPNSVADVAVPFPWEKNLRDLSPVTDLYSYLIAYWYRAGERWVLYDALPKALIDPEGPPLGVPVETPELLRYLNGPPPRELGDDATPFISDVQHAMWHQYGAYCRPFWVLQGDRGGHQVNFSPWQTNVLLAKGLPCTPPQIGSLPFAPFDQRTVRQLQHLNRLHQMDNNIERMRQSGSKAAADAEMSLIEREIRESEMRFIEEQMRDVSDACYQIGKTRSEHHDQLVPVAPGMAARAADAYDQFLETGDWTLRDVVGSVGNK